MGYTLMAESKQALDWAEVHRAVMPLRRRVELFPIPGEGGAGDALGVSVPQKNVNDLGWEEITQIADVLQKQFGMEVVDLPSGVRLGPDTLEAVKTKFLEEAPSEE